MAAKDLKYALVGAGAVGSSLGLDMIQALIKFVMRNYLLLINHC